MKNKFVQIEHVYAISDKDKEPNRYNYLNQWLSSDFDQKYYTLGSYCYGDSLNEEDLKKYNISESLGRGNKSLYLNHIKIFENILELYQPGQNFLVLESDAVPVEGYAEIINDQIVALKDKDWDILDVGNGLGWTPAIEGHNLSDKNDVYRMRRGGRCAHSIVWSYEGVSKIYQTLINLQGDLPIDHMISRSALKINANFYWGHPFAFRQGSQDGTYTSVNFN